MMKVLVIDDERPILELLEISLVSEGYEVLIADNGKEGLRLFEEEQPLKLVLTDIRMPGIDGIEVLKRIKNIDKEAEVVVVTGHGDMDSAIAALHYGASDFLTKPIRDEALLIALKRAEKKVSISKLLRDYTENIEQKVEECTAELRQTQEELIDIERLATIGETVAGLAHYIKNILTGLRGGMYMVDIGMTKNKTIMLQDGWGMVKRNIGKVSELVLDLLKYSKERMLQPVICKPNEIVADGVELMKERAKGYGIRINMVLDPDIDEASLDRDGIHDVLLNLISNAIDACIYDPDTTKSWEVLVTTRLEVDAQSGETILFEVSDNGCGMTDEVKQKLFSRFFSTKAGRSTGLGLLISQKIIHEHGGKISVESQRGKGTTFSVRLNLNLAEVSDGVAHKPNTDSLQERIIHHKELSE